MDTAKVFMSGRSQAVRLPKEYRFDTDEVYIRRTAEGVLLVPKSRLRLGDALAEALARCGGSDDDDFERPPQGELERGLDPFGDDAGAGR